MTPAISFIVPVRNDAARLDVCLTSIAHNRVDATAVEVIVVDNGSTDASREVARRHGATVVEIGDGPVSSLRNRGAQLARGEALAFVDADNEIGSDWIAAATENLSARAVGATGALYVPPPQGTWVQRGYGALRGRSTRREDSNWLGSGNLAVSRQAFESIGGFDTSLVACEDVDFCLRMRASGWRLLADPRLHSVHHGDPATLKALFISELWRGRDNLKVSLRRPIVWRGLPSAFVPVIDLLLLVVTLLGMVSAALGWSSGALIAVLGLALIVGGSAMRVAIARRRSQPTAASLAELMAVTVVYDLARAFANVARATHRSRSHGPAVAATS